MSAKQATLKSTWIAPNLHKALRFLAVEQDSNVQALVEVALREYLERQGCEIPELPAAPVLVS